MNTYLARTIYEDLRGNISNACSCSSRNWHKLCIATCTAIVLPASFVLQMMAFMIDVWAYPNNFDGNGTFACRNSDQPDARICGLGITVCSAELLLVCFGFGVCARSCMGSSFDLQSCSFCYACFIPTLSLVHGILSLTLCMITVEHVSNNKQFEYKYGATFYLFLLNGCTTIVVSLASACGYLCLRLCNVRHDNEHQIGSDDADRETTPVLQAM